MALTQEQQDAILGEAVDYVACEHYGPARAYLDIRHALRLDDPGLTSVIGSAAVAGVPLAWSSTILEAVSSEHGG